MKIAVVGRPVYFAIPNKKKSPISKSGSAQDKKVQLEITGPVGRVKRKKAI